MKFIMFALLLSVSSFANSGHYLSVGYDLLTTASFEDYSVTDGTNSASGLEAEMDFSSGFAISYEYRRAKANNWGFSVGFDYHSEKDIEELDIDGITFTTTGSDVATVSLSNLYFNAIYKWNIFYIPFGLNYANAEYNPPNTFAGSSTTTSGIGFNFGLGWELGDRFLIEYAVKSSSFGIETKDGLNENNFDDGAIAVSTLWLRYKLF